MGEQEQRPMVVCPECDGHPKDPNVRIEGGSRSCGFCNRTFTFNFMRDTGDEYRKCSCQAARDYRCGTCGGDGEILAPAPVDGGTPQAEREDGASLIAAERLRQTTEEGWTPEHDAEHTDGSIALAGAAYAALSTSLHQELEPDLPFGLWPWHVSWWRPSDDPVRNLIRAGALIAAEIDRLNGTSPAPPAAPVPPEPGLSSADALAGAKQMGKAIRAGAVPVPPEADERPEPGTAEWDAERERLTAPLGDLNAGHRVTLRCIAAEPDNDQYQAQWSGRLQGMAMKGLVWRFPDGRWQLTAYARELLAARTASSPSVDEPAAAPVEQERADVAALAAIIGNLWDYPPESSPSVEQYRQHLADEFGEDVAAVWGRLSGPAVPGPFEDVDAFAWRLAAAPGGEA